MSPAALRVALITLLVTAALAVASPAHATPILELSDGTTTVTIYDDGSGDLSSNNGQIIWSGAVGVFTTNVSVGLSKPITGTATTATLDLSTVNLSGAAGTLTMKLTDTSFTTGIGSPGDLSWKWGGSATGATVVGQGYLDPTNAAFGTSAITTGSLGPFDGAFSTSGSTAHSSLINPYSLTIVEAFTTSGSFSLASGNFELTNAAVPEPASLILLGTGLFGLAGVARRRSRKGKKQKESANLA